MSYIIQRQSIVKPKNEIYTNGTARKSEDFVFKDKESKRVIVCDGAGGTGLLAGEWANYIAKNIPLQPIRTVKDLDSWIEGIWESFYNQNIAKLTDPFHLAKFEKEGSASTFAAVWIMENQTVEVATYGDAMSFLWNKEQMDLQPIGSIQKLDDFDTFPFLVNWQTSNHNPDGFFHGTYNLQKGNVLLLASDGVASHIWASYEAFRNTTEVFFENEKIASLIKHSKTKKEKSFQPFVNDLKKTCKDEKKFKRYCQKQVTSNTMWNDDCSLIYIEKK
jgi:serine/threonine protein phosphatase PrpC